MRLLVIFVFAYILSIDLCSSASINIIAKGNKVELSGSIHNGQDAGSSKFPYYVRLLFTLRNLMSAAMCGGALISNRWVLTAAHCTNDMLYVTVYLGSTIRTESEESYTITYENFIEHPEFEYSSFEHDIALINIPFTQYTNKISNVQLPPYINPSYDYTGEQVLFSGFGLLPNNQMPTKLKRSHSVIIDNDNCKAAYKRFLLPETKLCFSTANTGTPCSGDSGGPLVLFEKGFLIGIFSYSNSRCDSNIPVVFTRVEPYLKWIEKETDIKLT